jgi:hypothetical protein
VIELNRPSPAPAGRTGCSGACACGVEPLAHPKYSFGMLLEPGSLALENRYHTLRANTHNIRLHDFGTVCGLRVEKHPSPQCVNTYAILRPGIALDCCGREIVVPESLFVPLEDGAVSGWCGASMGSTSATASAPAIASGDVTPEARAISRLYIYLRYAQCDTDPIPTYVRACGCCAPCEHGDCTPSVTREGYEVLVSSKPPVAWRNPVGAAFCEWLDVKLSGPGTNPRGEALYKQTLTDVLCDVITEPCADVCSVAGEALLLATCTFNADKTLTGIDNVTDRRLVISTGAIVEALACLTTAEIACCAATDAYLSLSATVAPAQVNLAALPAGNALTYTLSVNNTDAHAASDSFELSLAYADGALAFESATLIVDGTAQTAPAGSSTGVTVAIPAIKAGGSAQLAVVTSFDPKAHKASDTILATASIADYAGRHDPDVGLTTPFIDVPTDGPRVVTGNLPASLSPVQLANFLREGFEVPFTEAMDPATAVVSTAAAPGTVTLTTESGGDVTPFQITLTWNLAKTSVRIRADIPSATDHEVGITTPVTLTLAGGPKGGSFTGPCLRDVTDHSRLDGSPATGGNVGGESGDGTQGGDFVFVITPTTTPS